MSMNVDFTMYSSTGAADIERMLETYKAAGVDATATKDDNGIYAITVTNSAGTSTTFTVAVKPEIDKPADTTGASMKDISQKVADLAGYKGGSSGGGSVTSATASLGCIFDALMLLMQTQQEQKKNAAKLRTAESQTIQTQLTNEASQIRTTAEHAMSRAQSSMIASSVMLGASAMMQVGGFVAEGYAAKQADVGLAKGVYDEAKVNYLDAKNAQAPANDAPVAFTEELQNAMPQTKAAMPGLEGAETEVASAKQAYNQSVEKANVSRAMVDSDKQQISDLQAAKAQLPENDATATVEVGEKQMTGAEIDRKIDELNTKLETDQKAFASDGEKIAACKQRLTVAKIDYAKAANDVQKAMVADIGNMNEGDPQLENAKTFQNAQNGKMLPGMQDGTKMAYERASDNYNAAFNRQKFTAAGRIGSALEAAVQLTGQANQIQAQNYSAQAENIRAEGQAKSKESEASIEGHRAQQDTAKDMVQSAQESIANLQKMLQAVNDAENQLALSVARNI